MLPVLDLFGYGMGGYEAPNNTVPTGLSPNISSADFQPNDGVVNTVSMRGPNDNHILNAATAFPIGAPAAMAQNALGRYWHLGKNETMDDQQLRNPWTEDPPDLSNNHSTTTAAHSVT